MAEKWSTMIKPIDDDICHAVVIFDLCSFMLCFILYTHSTHQSIVDKTQKQNLFLSGKNRYNNFNKHKIDCTIHRIHLILFPV